MAPGGGDGDLHFRFNVLFLGAVVDMSTEAQTNRISKQSGRVCACACVRVWRVSRLVVDQNAQVCVQFRARCKEQVTCSQVSFTGGSVIARFECRTLFLDLLHSQFMIFFQKAYQLIDVDFADT
jgi:hypothetical protein